MTHSLFCMYFKEIDNKFLRKLLSWSSFQSKNKEKIKKITLLTLKYTGLYDICH